MCPLVFVVCSHFLLPSCISLVSSPYGEYTSLFLYIIQPPTDDLATWRMYHRIMDSRRRRQEEMLRGGGVGGDGDEYGSSTFFPPGFDPERHERMIRQAKSEADSVFRRTLLRSSTVNGRDDVDDDPDLHVLLPPSSGLNPSLCLTPGAGTGTGAGPESLVHMLARARRAGTEVAADYGDVFDIDM